MEGFRCSCIGCGRRPQFGATTIWVEVEGGMLCEGCWRASVHSLRRPSEKDTTTEDYCCFCSLCKRRPPDPDCKVWIETERGCLCERCWKETIGKLLAERIESSILQKKAEETGPVDVQLGCCLLNKKLLSGVINELSPGDSIVISADNVDAMKSLIRRYVVTKGCIITHINDKDGTTLLTIKRL